MPKKTTNIILIGFMGVGKGTIARAFIQETGMFGLDTDDLIESMENKKVKEIFTDSGEPYFRELEKKTAKWLSQNVKNSVISTGGGFFKQKHLNKIGTVVYLKSSYDGILNRILSHPRAEQKLAKRPLFQDREKAEALFNEREPQYLEKADIIVDVENKTPELIVEELIQQLD